MHRLRQVSRAHLLIILLAAIVSIVANHGAAIAVERHSRDESLFNAQQYLDHVSYLASDELEGRGTGQPGIDRAAEYIAAEFSRLGVNPAGDDGTYFQNFSLTLQRRIGDSTRLSVGTEGRRTRKPLELNTDFRPFPFSSSAAFKGSVVFAGYGIVDDDQNYNDYEGVDITDKIVMVLRRAPQFAEFDAGEHQSFRSKASRANARGAAAILVVNRPSDEDRTLYPFEASTGGFGANSYGIPMIHISEAAADELLKAGGLPPAAELEKTIEEKRAPASAELKGVTIRGEVSIEPIESPVRNVVGMIPGKGPQADEIIVLGAHYDHLGIRNKGDLNFDPTRDISNGADDNASGTALVMTMARVYTQGAAPNRSILLILFTGEELGLLGSGHFAKNPTVDLSKCVAMLNFDMVGRLRDDRLEVGGQRTGDFEEIVARHAERYALKIRDGGGGRGPSDHTNFYNKKIPVLFFFTGIHRQYHKPDDDTQLVNSDGAIRIARFAADIIDDIDSNQERPKFVEDVRRASIMRQGDDDDESRSDPPQARARGEGRERDPRVRGERGPRNPERGEDRSDAPRAENREDSAPRGVRLGIIPVEDDESGILVDEVQDGSPAALAGVKTGDRLVRIGKLDIHSFDDAVAAVSKLQWGDETTLGIVRDKEKLELKVRFPRPSRGNARNAPDSTFEDLKGMAARIEAVVKQLQSGGSDKVVAFRVETRRGEIALDVEVSDHESALKVMEPLVASMPDVIRTESTRESAVTIEMQLKWPNGSLGTRLRIGNRGRSDARDSAPRDRPRQDRAAARTETNAHGHGDAAQSDEARETMPPVRLGIMPTYGEGEGEGYEIEGVIDGGPAAQAGMKDGDRIYKIGDKKITNVYEYMEALRGYKPGSEVPVTVIRDGKKIELKIKASGAKVEAQ
ncbi:MAG: M28 family peptidase [Phycisphaerae bacterium]|nr:M28 family peptidase [Phycisphaerae bacterium]